MALNNRIIETETYITDEFKNIVIYLDNEGYIEINDKYNNHRAYFHKEEIDKYYNLLECAYDRGEYDEDEDEHYYSSEINLEPWEIKENFDIKFDKDYYGNWIIRDRIGQIQKSLIDFKNKYIKPLTVEQIKSLLQGKDNLSIRTLLYFKNYLDNRKEVQNGNCI